MTTTTAVVTDYFSWLPDHLIAEIAGILLSDPKGMIWMIRMACANRRIHTVIFESDYSSGLWNLASVEPVVDHSNIRKLPASVKRLVVSIGRTTPYIMDDSGAGLKEFPMLQSISVGCRPTTPLAVLVDTMRSLSSIKTLTSLRVTDDIFRMPSEGAFKQCWTIARIPKSVKVLELVGDLSTILRIKSATAIGELEVLSLRDVHIEPSMLFQGLSVRELRLESMQNECYHDNFIQAVSDDVVKIVAPTMTITFSNHWVFGGKRSHVTSRPCKFPKLESLDVDSINVNNLNRMPMLTHLRVQSIVGLIEDFDGSCNPTTIEVINWMQIDVKRIAALSTKLENLRIHHRGEFDTVVPSLVALSEIKMPSLRKLTIFQTRGYGVDIGTESACAQQGIAFIRKLFPDVVCIEHFMEQF